jgi:hypothetical protein
MNNEKAFWFNQVFVQFYSFDVMSFINVSQILRRFFIWYALHMFLHFFKKSLMRALFERTTFFLSSADNLICIVCVYWIFRVVDVSSVLRRRRLRALIRRCLICWQKFSINTSCLCFFMRCLKNICKRVICN